MLITIHGRWRIRIYITFAIVEHTLLNVYKDNKTHYAAAVGVDVREFRRGYSAIKKGGYHKKIIESTLAFYAARRGGVDEILLRCSTDDFGELPPDLKCTQEPILHDAKVVYLKHANRCPHDDRMLLLHQAAQDYANAIEAVCCGRNHDHCCACIAYTNKTMVKPSKAKRVVCPCVGFRFFTDTLFKAIERP